MAEWNKEITYLLRDGAVAMLLKVGVPHQNILVKEVSGAFELPLALKYFIEKGSYNALIGIGCLVKGDTPHFDFIAQAVSHRMSELSINHNIPIGFGLLTVNNYQQAIDRAGGKLGNKGAEAAEAILNLLSLKYELL